MHKLACCVAKRTVAQARRLASHVRGFVGSPPGSGLQPEGKRNGTQRFGICLLWHIRLYCLHQVRFLKQIIQRAYQLFKTAFGNVRVPLGGPAAFMPQ